jgi:hypothetical protein
MLRRTCDMIFPSLLFDRDDPQRAPTIATSKRLVMPPACLAFLSLVEVFQNMHVEAA